MFGEKRCGGSGADLFNMVTSIREPPNPPAWFTTSVLRIFCDAAKTFCTAVWQFTAYADPLLRTRRLKFNNKRIIVVDREPIERPLLCTPTYARSADLTSFARSAPLLARGLLLTIMLSAKWIR